MYFLAFNAVKSQTTLKLPTPLKVFTHLQRKKIWTFWPVWPAILVISFQSNTKYFPSYNGLDPKYLCYNTLTANTCLTPRYIY